jgi:hypothetical protein
VRPRGIRHRWCCPNARGFAESRARPRTRRCACPRRCSGYLRANWSNRPVRAHQMRARLGRHTWKPRCRKRWEHAVSHHEMRLGPKTMPMRLRWFLVLLRTVRVEHRRKRLCSSQSRTPVKCLASPSAQTAHGFGWVHGSWFKDFHRTAFDAGEWFAGGLRLCCARGWCWGVLCHAQMVAVSF